jgi:hypothetical protein
VSWSFDSVFGNFDDLAALSLISVRALRESGVYWRESIEHRVV